MGIWGVDRQRPFYSGKSCLHSIKYEIGVHPETGCLVWISGPAPGAMHDAQLSRNSGVLDLIKWDELILADKGYQGLPQVLTPIKKPRGRDLTADEKEVNYVIGSRRWIVEHVIGRIKNFACLSQPWRHALDMHHIVFFIICNIVNIDLKTRPMRK